VPLVQLTSERRTVGRPIAEYVGETAAAEPGTRVTVLIPEVEPDRLWLGSPPPRERSRAWGRLMQTSGVRSSPTRCVVTRTR
jgi:hypothetical protein